MIGCLNMNINLSQCENGSQKELNIGRLLDSTPEQEKFQVLSECCKKLAYGGILRLQGLNLDSFCKSHIFGGFANTGLLLNLKSVTKINEIKDVLQANRLKITNLKVENNIYYIEATK